ncbi:hypothetical protein GCM10009570_25310 [Dietzia natronolimnaea]
MTKWLVPKKQKGTHGTRVSLRIDSVVAEAVERVEQRVGRDEDGKRVSRSTIYLTGAMKLPEVREEVNRIKKEKRGERRQPTTSTG